MIEINGKEYRNLQEQVEKNMEDIDELKNSGFSGYIAGTGIEITGDDTKTISIDTDDVVTRTTNQYIAATKTFVNSENPSGDNTVISSDEIRITNYSGNRYITMNRNHIVATNIGSENRYDMDVTPTSILATNSNTGHNKRTTTQLLFSNDPDDNDTYEIQFPANSGTVALTSDLTDYSRKLYKHDIIMSLADAESHYAGIHIVIIDEYSQAYDYAKVRADWRGNVRPISYYRRQGESTLSNENTKVYISFYLDNVDEIWFEESETFYSGSAVVTETVNSYQVLAVDDTVALL